jgi:3-keto-5-aminohexanoate cleavage enzyme
LEDPVKKRKIFVSVAPVAHVGGHIPAGAKNPLSPEEIARDVINCAKAGASMVHLHVRDTKGIQVSSLKTFSKTLDLIRQESDIIIQGSTGGVSTLSLEQRCVSVSEPRTQVASLNMGSTNLGEGVYVNTLPDIRFWAKKMEENAVVPELEIFDMGMLGSIDKLTSEKLLKRPLNYNLCIGFEGAFEGKAKNLFYFSDALPADAHWSMIHENMEDLSLLAAAAGFGAGGVRVGFEDSFYYSPGKVASSNAELVERLVSLLCLMGFEIATVKETKKILGVRK